jgi:2-hydroxymuconate-semialdehyde hydrolase
VLLHSGEFGASAALSWEFNIAELAQHFRVIAPDWLGFGETDKLHDFVSKKERMLRHMTAFLEVMSIDEADFVGCSMAGGMLLREASSDQCRFPIRRLVIISGGGFMPDNEHRRALLEYDGTPDGMRRILEATFHDSSWWENDEYVRRRVESSLAPGAWEAVAAARLKAPNIPPRKDFGQDDTTAYERVPYPTLVLVGAEDKLRIPGWQTVFEERMPDVEVVVVEDAGHLLNIERADVFNEAASEFLMRPPGSALGAQRFEKAAR